MTSTDTIARTRLTRVLMLVIATGSLALTSTAARADTSQLYFDVGALAQSIPSGLTVLSYTIDQQGTRGFLRLTRKLDGSSPSLARACGAQTSTQPMIAKMHLAAGAQTIVFENAVCASYQIPPPNGEPPSEIVRFQFEKMSDNSVLIHPQELPPHPSPTAHPTPIAQPHPTGHP